MVGIFDSAIGKLKDSYNKRREDYEREEEMRNEARRVAQIEFEKEFRENVRELAIRKAKEDAMNKSGMAKFRALERARVLEEKKGPQKGFLQKLSDYTRSNIVKTSQRRKAYTERMALIKQLQAEKKQNNMLLRQQRMQRNMMLKQRKALKPFTSTLKKRPYGSI